MTEYLSGHVANGLCVGLQAFGHSANDFYTAPAPSGPGDYTCAVGPARAPIVDGLYQRFNYRHVYLWSSSVYGPADVGSYIKTDKFSPVVGAPYFGNGRASPMLDPNAHRALAGLFGQRQSVPRVRLAEATSTYHRTEIAIRPGGAGAPPRYVPPTQQYTPHRPPRAREHEGKAVSRTAKAGIDLANALDKVSEGAEIVDAVYEALPESVKRRWERGREERPGDSMGQYGLSGADWKLQAIWHNWDKIDPAEAIANVIKNEAEDRLYGAAHGAKDRVARPRNFRRTLGV